VRTYFGLAAAAVTATAALGVVGWIRIPDEPGSWLFMILFLPLLWAILESANHADTSASRAIARVHRLAIASMALMLLLEVGTYVAVDAALLGPDADHVRRRFSGLLTGALLALWGNHLPKLMSPWSLKREPFDWQRVHRFVGRVAVLAGLGITLAWSTLPIQAAIRVTGAIGLAALWLGLGYKAISVIRYR
jgi:uncharacterized membrane protein